jgi:alpha-tubulin suppressor-like RCC1 family protein
MSQIYPGGVISKNTPVTSTSGGPFGESGGSASGVWTLDQVAAIKKAGNWPKGATSKVLYSWGSNAQGQLGDNSTVNRSSPVQIGSAQAWVDLATMEYGSALIRADGTLWAWGYNDVGTLGINDIISRSSPVQVGSLTNWKSVAGTSYNCLAIKTDGTLWTWGYGFAGALGTGDTLNKSSPVQVGSDTNWDTIASHQYGGYAIKTNGTMWSWGYNYIGQLGVGDSVHRSSPTQIGSSTNWKLVFGTRYTGFGITQSGNLYGWGSHQLGEMGDGSEPTGGARQSPKLIGMSTWSAISGGDYTTYGIQTNGTLWSWGDTEYGELGNGQGGLNKVKSNPVQIGTGYSWSSVGGGLNHAVAVSSDGKLWAWGRGGAGSFGVLGLNDGISRSEPTQVGTDTDWVGVKLNTGKSNHTLAAKRS